MFFDVDQSSDAPDEATTETHAALLREQVLSLKLADSLHLARADLRPWVSYFVTNDGKLLNAAKRMKLRGDLQVITAPEAEARLEITAGEKPPTSPAFGSPLRQDHWWIP